MQVSVHQYLTQSFPTCFVEKSPRKDQFLNELKPMWNAYGSEIVHKNLFKKSNLFLSIPERNSFQEVIKEKQQVLILRQILFSQYQLMIFNQEIVQSFNGGQIRFWMPWLGSPELGLVNSIQNDNSNSR